MAASEVVGMTGKRVTAMSVPAVQWLLVGAITLLAAILRVFKLDEAGFRIDEGFTLTCARQSWAAVTGLHGYYTLHPPLFFTLVKITDLFAPETLSSRLVAVVAGIATIPVFYMLCRRLIDWRVAAGAALLLSISPLHIEFSRDGRMYAPIIFLVTLGWLALISFMQTRGRGWAVLYGLSLLLAFYMDYSAAYALAPQLIVLGIYLARARTRAIWLAGATFGAAIGYLPWLPQVYRAVDKSSGNAGRADWLSASWSRIGASIVSLLGFNGRTVTTGGDTPDVWGRWPDARGALLIVALAVLVLGLVALRSSRSVVIIVVMIGAPVLAAIVLSQVSPGYAPRTVMASQLGIAILASGFLIGRPLRQWIRLAGAAGWVYLVAIAIITLPNTYEVGARSEWPQISDDLVAQSHLSKPILVFSTAGMLTDMIDMYAGDKLDGIDIITVVDGEREKSIGYHDFADRGLSLAEISDGALERRLPQSNPDTDAIWVILRFGGGEIPGYLNDLGYEQIGAFRYTQTVLYLYARPNAQFGAEIPVAQDFAEEAGQDSGWSIANNRADVRAAGASSELVMTEDRGSGVFRFTPGAGGLVTAVVEVQARPDQAQLMLRCKSAADETLRTSRTTTAETDAGGSWQSIQLAALCPDGTQAVELSLKRDGPDQVAFRNVRIRFSPNQSGVDN